MNNLISRSKKSEINCLIIIQQMSAVWDTGKLTIDKLTVKSIKNLIY